MKYIVSLLCIVTFALGCSKVDTNELIVGVSADYPPFEFKDNDTFKGFDIDVITAVANKLGKKVRFVDTSFPTLLPMLHTGRIDVAISCITATPERERQFAFSTQYFFDTIVAIYTIGTPYTNVESLKTATIGVQLGTTMQQWAQENLQTARIVTMDTSLALVEALKAKHIDAVLLDMAQGNEYVRKSNVALMEITKEARGYVIAMKKGSVYQAPINKALAELQTEGVITMLEKKWLYNGGK